MGGGGGAQESGVFGPKRPRFTKTVALMDFSGDQGYRTISDIAKRNTITRTTGWRGFSVKCVELSRNEKQSNNRGPPKRESVSGGESAPSFAGMCLVPPEPGNGFLSRAAFLLQLRATASAGRQA